MIKTLFIGMFCFGCISCDNSTQPIREVEVEMHNWECRYIIHDGYNQRINPHYVNDYTRNVDNSISYDFWKVIYHNIDFNNLHEVK